MDVIRKYILETNNDLFLGNQYYTTETYRYSFHEESNSILYEADIENIDPSFRWILYLLPLGNELKETFFKMKMNIHIQQGLFLVHMKSIHFDVEITVTMNTDKMDIQDIRIDKMDFVSSYSYSFLQKRITSQIKSFVRRDVHHVIQHIHQWTVMNPVEPPQ